MRPLLLAAGLLAGCTSIATGPGSLERTRWHVSAINGQETPQFFDRYVIQFVGGRLSARFGCNSIGGTYRLAAETLTVREVRSTLMGCPEPAATFEREGQAVLVLPMHVEWTSGVRVRLVNQAGSLDLERIG